MPSPRDPSDEGIPGGGENEGFQRNFTILVVTELSLERTVIKYMPVGRLATPIVTS